MHMWQKLANTLYDQQDMDSQNSIFVSAEGGVVTFDFWI